MLYLDWYYIVLVVPMIIISFIAQASVKSNYRKFSRIANSRGLTGAMAAEKLLSHYGVNNVRIEPVAGELSDHYDPRSNVIRLSEGVYNAQSVSAVCIACHEAGHATQHAEGYTPIKIRDSIIPVCNIGSRFGIPLALLGYVFGIEPLITIGIVLYSLVFFFQLITLPVEFNASSRALSFISETGLLSEDEHKGAKKVLKAAAMTYVAAAATTLANILRLILRMRRRS
ncbi:MAG: zinc metallopeptidase [Clostridiales bacterium]|nr:zinc metallopeptidase [Clostridiales bacterium]